MNGKIVKGIAGFYYVSVVGSGIYECKAKGIFRKEGIRPLVGDMAEIEVLDETEKTANLVDILPRKNELIRPAVANVDQALVIFALQSPRPNPGLLDRFLILLKQQEVPVHICLNKTDLVQPEEAQMWKDTYTRCGYRVLLCSMEREEGLSELKELLRGKTTVVAGPSGVGKSTITNALQGEIHMETGEISRKLKRGRHTTRHSQLINIDEETYLCDTPGFTSLYTADLEKEDLRKFFPEFAPYEGQCRYLSCVHQREPECAVKQAVKEGKIPRIRYESYSQIYEELKSKRRY